MDRGRLKKRLYQGELAVGPFLKITDPAIVEIAAYAGFDYVIIDSEHGPISMESAQNMIRAAGAAGITPIIRVLKNEPELILRALDIGAHGVQVPEVNTREQAEKLVEASRYYPQGSRGVCRFVRAAQYSKQPKDEYFRSANETVTVIAHLEGVEGISNLDAILEVEGIDVLFIGPYDLSQSMGIPGQIDHPDLIENMISIVQRAEAKGKIIGTFVETPQAAREWAERGVKYISYSVDVGMIFETFSAVVQAVHE